MQSGRLRSGKSTTGDGLMNDTKVVDQSGKYLELHRLVLAFRPRATMLPALRPVSAGPKRFSKAYQQPSEPVLTEFPSRCPPRRSQCLVYAS